MEPHWRRFGLFLVGVLLVLGSIGVGLSAVKYEFHLVSAADEPQQASPPLTSYEDLPADEQRVVRAAIDGRRFVSATEEPVPGRGTVGLGGELRVLYEDRYYVFARQPFYVTSSPRGLAGIAMALGGLVLVVEAIRRQVAPAWSPLPSRG